MERDEPLSPEERIREPEPSYRASVPLAVILDSPVSRDAKLLYVVIESLTRRKGYCWASNKFLAKLMKAPESSMRRWLAELVKQRLAEITVVPRRVGSGGTEREIRLFDNTGYCSPKSGVVLTNEQTPLLTHEHISTDKKESTLSMKERGQPVLLEAQNGTFSDSQLEALWNEWRQHLKEKRRPQSPTTIKRQVAKLRGMTVERAKAALQFSMECGYTGIFERNETSNTRRYKTGNTGTCNDDPKVWDQYEGVGKVR